MLSACWLGPRDLEDLGRSQGRIMLAQLRVILKSILDTEVPLRRIRESKGKTEGVLLPGKHLKKKVRSTGAEGGMTPPTYYVCATSGQDGNITKSLELWQRPECSWDVWALIRNQLNGEHWW